MPRLASPRLAAILLLVAACRTTVPPTPSPHALVLAHATVIDTTGGPSIPDVVVVVEGNRVEAVEPAGRATLPKHARVVDAMGKYLIPGLWDMHTHLFSHVDRPGTNRSAWAFPLYVANGVTGVRDMWTDPDDIATARRWNELRAQGTLLAPHLEWSSRIVDGDPPHIKGAAVVTTPDQARQVVEELKAGGAGFIKTYWNLRREVFFAIAEQAKKSGIPFAGHVPSSVSAFEASDAGMKSIEHLTGIEETCSTRSDEFQRIPPQNWTPKLGDLAFETFDEKRCADLFARFARNGTWQVPTLLLLQSLGLAQEAGIASSPALDYVPAFVREKWHVRDGAGRPLALRRARFARLLRFVGDLHRAGVGILAGSDFGNPLMVAGFSLHDELALLTEAGLTPLQALQTATRNVGVYFGRNDIGTITQGSVGDLVILDADPVVDIRNTRRIAGVVLGGRYLDRQELQALLDRLR
jgi:imidazolonepropionase-like amidohydrolase